MKEIERVQEKYLKKNIPDFSIGDTVKDEVKISEKGKRKLTDFEGIVIKKKGRNTAATFTVRRISYGEGVERTFPLHSPSISNIEVKKKGDVKRAKLYYLRGKKGKKSKVAEKIETAREDTK